MRTICTIDTEIGPLRTDTMQVSHHGTARPQRFFTRVIAWIVGLEKKRLSRLALLDLTDEQLADIGVTSSEARREAARPFWN